MKPVESSWADHARAAVAGAGYHRGAARDALIELFAAESCALSEPEVESRFVGVRPVGRASIYRALDVLSGLGLLARVELGDGLLRFERAGGAGAAHHHHLICDGCGRLIAFDDPELELAIGAVGARLGFDAREHEVTVRGVCTACRSDLPRPVVPDASRRSRPTKR